MMLTDEDLEVGGPQEIHITKRVYVLGKREEEKRENKLGRLLGGEKGKIKNQKNKTPKLAGLSLLCAGITGMIPQLASDS